jgi:hypothetical protein
LVCPSKGRKTLRVFENKMLRRIFGHKKEVTAGWRKLHELHDLYALCDTTRVITLRRIR